MRVALTCATPNRCVSFGYAAIKVREQLTRLADVVDDVAQADVEIFLGSPKAVRGTEAERLVWYAVCETTRVPPAFAAILNCATAVITDSTFCRDVFERCGVTVPVHVVHHGIDGEDFAYIDRPPRATYTFFWQGTSLLFDRKCGYRVEQAFRELDLPDSRLLLKTVPYPAGEMDISIGKIRQTATWASLSEIRVMDDQADCFVWPTRGEGFGMLALEKMATGLPVICTNWSGPADYLRDGVALPINEYEMQPAIYGEGWGLDARVDLEALKKHMLWCYNNREAARAIGRAASEYVLSEWKWEKRVHNQLQAALGSLALT